MCLKVYKMRVDLSQVLVLWYWNYQLLVPKKKFPNPGCPYVLVFPLYFVRLAASHWLWEVWCHLFCQREWNLVWSTPFYPRQRSTSIWFWIDLNLLAWCLQLHSRTSIRPPVLLSNQAAPTFNCLSLLSDLIVRSPPDYILIVVSLPLLASGSLRHLQRQASVTGLWKAFLPLASFFARVFTTPSCVAFSTKAAAYDAFWTLLFSFRPS